MATVNSSLPFFLLLKHYFFFYYFQWFTVVQLLQLFAWLISSSALATVPYASPFVGWEEVFWFGKTAFLKHVSWFLTIHSYYYCPFCVTVWFLLLMAFLNEKFNLSSPFKLIAKRFSYSPHVCLQLSDGEVHQVTLLPTGVPTLLTSKIIDCLCIFVTLMWKKTYRM